MDSADEQDVENPGGMANGANGTNGANGANGANGTNGTHGANGANGAHGTNGQHPTPEGSLSFREEIDESDLDDEVQDDEDLLSHPLQGNSQSQLDIAAQVAGTSSLAHLNNFMNMHPQLLAKLKIQYNDADIQTRNGLEVLQAAMSGSSFMFPPSLSFLSSPPPPPLMPQQQQQQQPQRAQNNHSYPFASSPGNIVENQLMMASSSVRASVGSSQTGESPQRNCRNNSESSQGSSKNNGESRECEPRPGTSSGNNQHPSGSNWNFEEQFRQVRQLYELDENPDRKEFLDNLFTFMQQRGTPINRLPIMAKSVLDLYELYKLVVTRGGLVEVINKKLWQEIIKGLRLPASITSAAFTLRTQYMKYLYPYEQQKENLSTQEQLQTAIETNRRESRRGNYTTYATNNESMVARSQHNPLPNTLSQLPLGLPLAIGQMDIGAQSPFVNGHPQHHPHNPQHLPPNLSSNFTEYIKRFQEQKPTTNNSIGQQQSGGTPISPSTTETFNALELSRNLWQMSYNNTHKIYSGVQPSYSSTPSESPSVPTNSPEQEKALDLANSAHRSDPVSSPSASRSVSSPPSGNMKRNQDATDLSPSTSTKRVFSDEENLSESTPNSMRVMQTVTVRDNGQRELMISVELNGVTYEGVLPAKNDDASSTSSNSNTIKRSRNSES